MLYSNSTEDLQIGDAGHTSKIIILVLDSQSLRDLKFWSASLRAANLCFYPSSSWFFWFCQWNWFPCLKIIVFSAFSVFPFFYWEFMLFSSLGTLVSHQNSVVLPEPDTFSRTEICYSAPTIRVLCFKMEFQSKVKFAIINSICKAKSRI